MRKSGFKMSDFKKTCAATQISWSFDIKTSPINLVMKEGKQN